MIIKAKLKIEENFRETGNFDLFEEFLDTLIMPGNLLTRKLQSKIWTLCTTSVWSWSAALLVIEEEQWKSPKWVSKVSAEICTAFQNSKSENDLCERWEEICARYWPDIPANSPIKKEVDALNY